MTAEPIRIVYIINWLRVGGAETVLHRLLQRLDRRAFAPQVICLTDLGPLAEQLRAEGIPVRLLGMRRGMPNPVALLRLARWLRELQPHLVHTWLYHADLLGGLANWLSVRAPLLWHLHNTLLPRGASKLSTLWTVKACARLSRRLPDRILCCAQAACHLHAELGYDAGRMTFLPNGFALDTFRPQPACRAALRVELGLAPDTPLVGLVARWDPVKGHRTFIEAAALLHRRRPDVHFVLAGAEVTPENPQLAEWIAAQGVGEHVHLLGHRTDMPQLYAALDVATSASITEAFPNVVGEAMACGVPCVVTDVGDSALIVGDTGRVVPAQDAASLAAGWASILALPEDERRALGAAARERILQNFELGAIVARTESIYREMTQHVRN